MIAALLRRLGGLAATLVAASVVVFLVLSVLPGDTAAVILGIGAQEDTIASLRRELGLDRPLAVQYAAWLAGLVTGDLGRSHTYAVPVADLVAERATVSLPLAVLAMLISTAIALPAGILAAARHRRLADTLVSVTAQLGVAVPNFWLGMVLVIVFALGLGLVPPLGFPGWEAGVGPALRALVLPAVALALPQAAILTRVVRASVLEALVADHVRTARARGLTRSAALLRHAVPNALIPVVTILGLQFAFLIAGTIVIENVFNLAGLGKLLFQAIASRDLVTVRSLIMLLVAAVVVVNALVDLAYLALDPRLRTPGHGRA